MRLEEALRGQRIAKAQPATVQQVREIAESRGESLSELAESWSQAGYGTAGGSSLDRRLIAAYLGALEEGARALKHAPPSLVDEVAELAPEVDLSLRELAEYWVRTGYEARGGRARERTAIAGYLALVGEEDPFMAAQLTTQVERVVSQTAGPPAYLVTHAL